MSRCLLGTSLFALVLLLSCESREAPSVEQSAVPLAGTSVTDAKPETMPVAVATIDLKDGTSYRLSEAAIQYLPPSNAPFYRDYGRFTIDYVPVHDHDSLLMKVPISAIATIEFVRSRTEFDFRESVKVTLKDGGTVSGQFRDTKAFLDRPVETLKGRGTVDGFPAEIAIAISDISRIVFQGDGVANVEKTDKSIMEGIREISFMGNAGDDRSASADAEVLRLTRGTATLEIPIAEVASISLSEEQSTVSTTGGKTLTGQVTLWQYAVTGSPMPDQQPNKLEARFSARFEAIAKVTFHRPTA